MTSAIEYSYLNTNFSLNIDEKVLSRAVRVKNIVKDKIKRVFDNKLVDNSKQGSITVTEESLLDLSENTLSNIAEKLDRMQAQSSVPCISNRAVLFTNALLSKIRLVTNKWYPYNEKLLSQNNVLSHEVGNVNIINNLGGDVVPGTWDSVGEIVEHNENDFVPEIEQNYVPEIQTEVELPNLESDNGEINVSVNEPPVVKYTVDDSDVYSFEPNTDEFVSTFYGDTAKAKEFVYENDVVVPEPRDLSNAVETEFVPEPIAISEEHNKIEIEAVASSGENKEEENKEHVVEEKSSYMSVEDKIAQLLQKGNNASQPAVKKQEELGNKNSSNFGNEKGEFTQTHIMARLRRVLNEMAEKDEQIKKLSIKNSSIAEELVQVKDKVRDYETVVSDLTAKNDSLVKENEKLTSKVSDVQSSSQGIIAKLESQVEDLTKAKNEESESSKEIIAELKSRHVEEIAALKEKHSKEMQSVNESKEKQIQAIYATISEVLGDSSIDESFDRSLAA